jgi:hypothetical protein
MVIFFLALVSVIISLVVSGPSIVSTFTGFWSILAVALGGLRL